MRHPAALTNGPRRAGRTGSRALVVLLVALLGSSAAAVPAAAAESVQFAGGQARVELTVIDTGARETLDLELSRGSSGWVPGEQSTFRYNDPTNPDPSTRAAIQISVPSQVGQYETRSLRSGAPIDEVHGINVSLARSSGISYGSTDSADRACTISLEGSLETGFQGSFRCSPLTNPTRDSEADLEVSGTFSTTTGPSEPSAEVGSCGTALAAVMLAVEAAADGCEVDLAIERIEVLQVLGDEDPVTLVAGKSTVARVYVRYTGVTPSVTGVSAHLRAAPGGRLVDGEATPLNGPIDLPVAEPAREQTNTTLNFLLPPDWTQPGAICVARQTPAAGCELTLQASIVVPAGLVDTNATNDLASASALFVASKPLRIAYVAMCPAGIATNPCPLLEIDDAAFGKRLRQLYPLADDGVELYQLFGLGWSSSNPMRTGADVERLRVTLRRLYLIGVLLSLEADEGYPDQLVAVVPPVDALVRLAVGGGSDPPWTDTTSDARKSHTAWVLDTRALDVAQMSRTLAHEIGHNMGLRHPNIATPECKISVVDPEGTRPVIGVTGFDVAANAVIPRTHYDLMSYCPNGVSWISPDSYRMLQRALQAPPADGRGPGSRDTASVEGAEPAPAPLTAEAGSAWVIASGTVSQFGEGTLDPAVTVTAARDFTEDGGDGPYCVRLLSDGEERGSSCFDVSFADVEGQPLEEQAFALALPMAADVDRLTLEYFGEEVASIEARGGAPTVAFDAGTSETTWSTPQELTWTGTGGSGDPLTYTILYSPDGGATWLPLAADLDEARLRFDPSTAPDGSLVTFRVLASDGLRTASADLGPFALRGGSRPIDESGGASILDVEWPSLLLLVLLLLLAGSWLVWRARTRRSPIAAPIAAVAMVGAPAAASAVVASPAGCANCGVVPAPADRFCGSCGAPLPASMVGPVVVAPPAVPSAPPSGWVVNATPPAAPAAPPPPAATSGWVVNATPPAPPSGWVVNTAPPGPAAPSRFLASAGWIFFAIVVIALIVAEC